MNLAFLVEGTSELKLYPKWIDYLSTTPLTECVSGYQAVVDNQFTIFNVDGIGKMRNAIPVAINNIIANDVFDYLVIVVDGDNKGVESRKLLIHSIINETTTPQLPSKCQLKVIVQNICIETWFTGHTDHYQIAKTCRDRGILKILDEYDVKNNDPELMPNCQPSRVHSIGQYHKMYLTQMLKGVNRTWSYREATPHTLIDIPYFQRLEQRLIETPTHLNSFADMITFLKSL
jgi:hypothetical protein